MLAAGVEPEIHAKTEMDVFVACCPPQWPGLSALVLHLGPRHTVEVFGKRAPHPHTNRGQPHPFQGVCSEEA